ncbi:MAG: hypothetical protein MJ217_02195 [Bacilli bacterium]|nr:hypothetical protein [Bacilli bacterium]
MKKLIIGSITILLNLICLLLTVGSNFISEVVMYGYTLKHIELETYPHFLFENFPYVFILLVVLFAAIITLCVINLIKENKKIQMTLIILGVLSILVSICSFTIFGPIIASQEVERTYLEEIGATKVVNYRIGLNGIVCFILLFISGIFDLVFARQKKKMSQN